MTTLNAQKDQIITDLENLREVVFEGQFGVDLTSAISNFLASSAPDALFAGDLAQTPWNLVWSPDFGSVDSLPDKAPEIIIQPTAYSAEYLIKAPDQIPPNAQIDFGNVGSASNNKMDIIRDRWRNVTDAWTDFLNEVDFQENSLNSQLSIIDQQIDAVVKAQAEALAAGATEQEAAEAGQAAAAAVVADSANNGGINKKHLYLAGAAVGALLLFAYFRK